MKPYFELPGFEELYLEDSVVLNVVARPGVILITADLVLRENHPSYRPPHPGEQYCYRRGLITFRGVSRLTWHGPEVLPALSADNEADFGGVDLLGLDGPTYILQGDFGKLEVDAATCTAELEP